VTDPNPIDTEAYECACMLNPPFHDLDMVRRENREEYLQSLARDGVQALLASLFSLPTVSTADGPLAQLPPATTPLPRSKPLPKAKAPTKWERFAAAKGIQKTRRERKVWDEEKQDWVARWGRDGKNREPETQWLSEVKANAPVDFDPAADARAARKARVAKNERQHLQNAARAQGAGAGREERKGELDREIVTARVSTASMGRFDKKLEGEKKLKGVKRKVWHFRAVRFSEINVIAVRPDRGFGQGRAEGIARSAEQDGLGRW
jgi:regulator of ribosome biosynthesis